MTLFLLTALPLFYLYVNSLFRSEGVRLRYLTLPFVSGTLLYVPAVLIHWGTRHLFPYRIGFGARYGFAWFGGIGLESLSFTLFMVILILVSRRVYRTTAFREYAALAAGFWTAAGIKDALLARSWYGQGELFLQPVLRVIMAGAAAFLLSRMAREQGWERLFYLVLALVLPFLLTFIPLLNTNGHVLVSWLVTLPAGAGVVLLAALESRGRIPR